jgi:pimeloyl-ACP methyl ester carboxylesterase
MNRRNLLRTAASATVGAGLLALDAEGILASTAQDASFHAPNTQCAGPYIQTLDQTQLFYRDWGTGQPVVFVHSWAVNSDLWQYQMIHLSQQGFRCIAYDQRGFGRSADPGHGYDLNTLADDLAAVLDQLNLSQVTLVGHSMGCKEIVRYLTRHGSSRIVRIVLISPGAPLTVKTPENPDGVDAHAIQQLQSAWTSDFPKWLAENARPFFVPETSPATVDWGTQMCLQASLKALVDCNNADAQADMRTELRKIQLPTLIIHGTVDVSTPLEKTGRKVAQLVKGSRLTIYEGAPHGLMLTHTERLNRELASFLRA